MIYLVLFLLMQTDEVLLQPIIWEKPDQIHIGFSTDKSRSLSENPVSGLITENVAFVKTEQLAKPLEIFPFDEEEKASRLRRHTRNSFIKILEIAGEKHRVVYRNERAVFVRKNDPGAALLAAAVTVSKIVLDKTDNIYVNRAGRTNWHFIEAETGIYFFDTFENARLFALGARPQFYHKDLPEQLFTDLLKQNLVSLSIQLFSGHEPLLADYFGEELEESEVAADYLRAAFSWRTKEDPMKLLSRAEVYRDAELAESIYEQRLAYAETLAANPEADHMLELELDNVTLFYRHKTVSAERNKETTDKQPQ